jgi:hypothetical protein
MPEAIDVTCPCCGTLLRIDPGTGSIVWSERRKEPAKDFDELVTRVRSQKSTLDEKFARSVQQNLIPSTTSSGRRHCEEPAGAGDEAIPASRLLPPALRRQASQ